MQAIISPNCNILLLWRGLIQAVGPVQTMVAKPLACIGVVSAAMIDGIYATPCVIGVAKFTEL